MYAIASAPANATTVIVTGGTGGNQPSLSIAKFDAALGTLTGVTISYSLGFIFGGSLGNFGNSPASATVTLGNGTSLLKDATGNTLVSGTVLGNSANFTVPGSPGRGAPGTVNFSLAAIPLAGTLAALSDAPSLAAFTGPGNYTFTVGFTPGTTSTSGSAVYFGGAVNTNDSLSIAYTYDATPAAVPEPAAWAMMLIGFGAIGSAARHRRPGFKVVPA